MTDSPFSHSPFSGNQANILMYNLLFVHVLVKYTAVFACICNALWKWMKGNLTKVELGSQKGEPFYSTSFIGRTDNYGPQKKNCQQKRNTNSRPQQEKMHIASPTRNRPPQQLNQRETIIILNSCFFPMDFSSKQSFPTCSFSIERFFSFVCWTSLWFLSQLTCPKLQFSAILE